VISVLDRPRRSRERAEPVWVPNSATDQVTELRFEVRGVQQRDTDPMSCYPNSYRVHTWWDRPGEARPGEDDLGQGWARCGETVWFHDADAVASYIKGHPEAEGAEVDELDPAGHIVGQRFMAEHTIAGWIMSFRPEDV
jgi:hypothetical protein